MSKLNSISRLTKLNFSLLLYEEKIKINKESKPKLLLVIIIETKWNNRVIKKSFNKDIFDYILSVCQNKIKNKINQAELISLIADETTDLSTSFQMSIVFRYV